MKSSSLLERIRAKGALPKGEQTSGLQAAIVNDNGELTYCANGTKQVEDITISNEDEPPMIVVDPELLSDSGEDDLQVEDRWRRIEERTLVSGLGTFQPQVFIQHATTHGFYCVVEGQRYYVRYRYVLREQSDDRKLLLFMGIEFRVEEDQIVFDFSKLPQTGLKFRQGRVSMSVPEMVLAVQRQRRNFWTMSLAAAN